MSGDPNEQISLLLSVCNRIVVTAQTQFDPKDRTRTPVLADIRDPAAIEIAKNVLLVEPDSCRGSWMSPVDIYIAFLTGKSLIGSVGVVLDSWLRSSIWEGDYAVSSDHDFRAWLKDHVMLNGPLGR